MKQTGQSWAAASTDSSRSALPSRFRSTCAGFGGLLIFLSGLAIIALVPAWLEFGEWNEVLTWFAAIEGAVFLLGMALFWFGDRRP